jgi:hypothetical protein
MATARLEARHLSTNEIIIRGVFASAVLACPGFVGAFVSIVEPDLNGAAVISEFFDLETYHGQMAISTWTLTKLLIPPQAVVSHGV